MIPEKLLLVEHAYIYINSWEISRKLHKSQMRDIKLISGLRFLLLKKLTPPLSFFFLRLVSSSSSSSAQLGYSF